MAERSEAAIVTNQLRVAPALSATSDAPVVVETPADDAVVETKVDDKTAKVDAGKDEKKVEAKADDKTKDETPPAIKAEITKERNRRRDAEAKAADTQSQLDKALKALENVTGNKPQGEDKPEPRPERAKFTDAALYDDALVEWASRAAARTEAAKAATKAANDAKTKGEEAVKAKIDGMQKAWTKARDAFVAEHPDYEEIAESEDLQISHAVAAALLEDPETGVKLAYWLGQNPDEAERVSKLSPSRAAIELGRISERLEAKPAREKKAAPINPLRAGRGEGNTNTREPTAEEWFAKRSPEIQASRRPFLPAGRPN